MFGALFVSLFLLNAQELNRVHFNVVYKEIAVTVLSICLHTYSQCCRIDLIIKVIGIELVKYETFGHIRWVICLEDILISWMISMNFWLAVKKMVPLQSKYLFYFLWRFHIIDTF